MFVIQSLPRCGTHLVETALRSHGDIECFGEVFNPHGNQHGFLILRPSIQEVFDHCLASECQSGFLAHAYVGLTEHDAGNGLDDSFQSRDDVQAAYGLWQALPHSVKVVTLWRENLLARYVSLLIAQTSKTWNVWRGEPLPDALSVRIDCCHMLLDFQRIDSLIRIARARFPSALVISYEELTADLDLHLTRIQNHLEVEVKTLTPETIKIGRSISDSVVNYKEVVECLVANGYSQFIVPQDKTRLQRG